MGVVFRSGRTGLSYEVFEVSWDFQVNCFRLRDLVTDSVSHEEVRTDKSIPVHDSWASRQGSSVQHIEWFPVFFQIFITRDSYRHQNKLSAVGTPDNRSPGILDRPIQWNIQYNHGKQCQNSPTTITTGAIRLNFTSCAVGTTLTPFQSYCSPASATSIIPAARSK